MHRGFAVLTAVALVAAPSVASAGDPTDLDAWHEDVLLRAVIPLGPSAYQDVAGFGGGLGVRAYLRHFEVGGEASAFTRNPPGGIAEILGYRLRGLAGYRHTRELSLHRAIIFRALGGV